MADVVDATALKPDSPQEPSGSPSSPSQKRKRLNESSSPETRKSKRKTPVTTGVAAPTMGSMANDIQAAAAAFLQVQNVDNHNDVPQLSAEDVSALQEATAELPVTADMDVTEGTPPEDVGNLVDHADPANASSTAAAALNNMEFPPNPTMPTIHIPKPTAANFETQYTEIRSRTWSERDRAIAAANGDMDFMMPREGAPRAYRETPAQPKPAVGSEEWTRMRKDNHKEVERRRRETINEGINELSKIVPGCEKNKGSILQRAVTYIQALKENESQNIEKWTLEKLLTEQAVNELSTSNDKLKKELTRAYNELESWKRVATDAGLQPLTKEPSAPAAN